MEPTRDRITHKQATKLLRKWSTQGKTVIVAFGFRTKFMFQLAGGKLGAIGENGNVFLYSQADTTAVISPCHFQWCERSETEDSEILVFSDGVGTDAVCVYCPKRDESVSIEQVSNWLN